jgi:hypothetical protein
LIFAGNAHVQTAMGMLNGNTAAQVVKGEHVGSVSSD